MTKTEFKKLIANSIEYDWYKNKQIAFTLPLISFNETFNGIGAFYDFITTQYNGWNAITENIPPELNNSKKYFNQIKAQIEAFAMAQANNNSNQLESYWQNNMVGHIVGNIAGVLTYNCTETIFLIDVFNKEETYYHGAYRYVVSDLSNINSNKNDFIGASIANDFLKKEAVFKFSRKGTEQNSFEKLKNDFQNRIDESSSIVTDHLNNANKEYKKYVLSLEELKTEKDLAFQEWFNTSKEAFVSFDKTSNDKVKDLEKLYQENLSLKAPATYWEERSNDLKSQGIWWLCGLILSTITGVVLLYYLLDSIGTGEFENLFSNTGASIKWSIVFITFISFLAFLIRTFTKLTFSSFHLSRDAQERKQLTLVYLALKENDAVSDIDRNIVLQSIFSRADTGLLKEDSSPTMPTSIIEKVVKTS
ncbi:DUF6161 domain-containing protein [Yeosuana sp.]|uniref:DUF6161 domain-containing protein n=1 Tax=Yeosuana sp. TaxID=2529388 RepID=UPI004054A2B0